MRDCRTYWGTHGCLLPRGHGGSHVCVCAVTEQVDAEGRVVDGEGNVGAWPYYGPDTRFYGEDAVGTPAPTAEMGPAGGG